MICGDRDCGAQANATEFRKLAKEIFLAILDKEDSWILLAISCLRVLVGLCQFSDLLVLSKY